MIAHKRGAGTRRMHFNHRSDDAGYELRSHHADADARQRRPPMAFPHDENEHFSAGAQVTAPASSPGKSETNERVSRGESAPALAPARICAGGLSADVSRDLKHNAGGNDQIVLHWV